MFVVYNLLHYIYSFLFASETLVLVNYGDEHDVEAHVSFYGGEILIEKAVYFKIQNRKPWTSHEKILAMVDLWSSNTYGDLADDVIIDGQHFTWGMAKE